MIQVSHIKEDRNRYRVDLRVIPEGVDEEEGISKQRRADLRNIVPGLLWGRYDGEGKMIGFLLHYSLDNPPSFGDDVTARMSRDMRPEDFVELREWYNSLKGPNSIINKL